MNLIIKACNDDHFIRVMESGILSRDDLLVCAAAERGAVLNFFQPERIHCIGKRALIPSSWDLVKTARSLGAQNILYISAWSPPVPYLLALHVLALLTNTRLYVHADAALRKPSGVRTLASLLILIFSPALSLVLAPWFLITEVAGKFLATREQADAPFLAFGKRGRLSGVLYWYSFTNRAMRNGLFGYSFHEYLGVPASLYNFPLSIFLLSRMRFRATFILGFLLLFSGVFMFYRTHTNLSFPLLAAMMVAFMASNIIWEHAALGVYEIIAWGFGSLSILLALSGHFVIAGLPLGLTMFSHLGVATLTGLLLLACALLHGQFFQLIVGGIIAGAVAAYWLVPYLNTRREITRTRMINEEYEYTASFGVGRLVQFITYSVFPLLLFLTSRNIEATVVASLPLAIAFLNAKVKWIYSPYTIRMFQAVSGIYALGMAGNMSSIPALLYFHYLPPALLSWMPHDDRFYFTLAPNPRRDVLDRCADLFGGLSTGDRVGFECGSRRAGWKLSDQYLAVLFNYYLSDKEVEVFNSGMTELVKYDLFKKICRNFNALASFEEIGSALRLSGVTHIVAFSDRFKKRLEEFGFVRTASRRFEEQLKSAMVDVTAVLYKVPFDIERSSPPAEIAIGRNCLLASFLERGDHTLLYSYHPGLTGSQNNRPLMLAPDENGLIAVKGAEPGQAKICFHHNRLFRMRPSGRHEPVDRTSDRL